MVPFKNYQVYDLVQSQPIESQLQLPNSSDQQYSFITANIKNRKNSALDQVKLLHDQFYNKLNKIDQLNSQFSVNQQKMFLKTFINIMDRMSNQFKSAVMACQNIDDQIKKDSKCILLAQKLKYFKSYYLNSETNFTQSQQQFQNQIEKNKVLKQKKEYLLKKLYQIQQKNQKKKRKNKTILIKENLNEQQVENFQSFTKKHKNQNMETKPTSNNVSRKISLNQSKISQTQQFNSSNFLMVESMKTRSKYRSTAKSLHRQTKLSDFYKQLPQAKQFISSSKDLSSQIQNNSLPNKTLYKINEIRQNTNEKMKNKRFKTKFNNQRNAHTSQKRMNKSKANIQNGFNFEVANI